MDRRCRTTLPRWFSARGSLAPACIGRRLSLENYVRGTPITEDQFRRIRLGCYGCTSISGSGTPNGDNQWCHAFPHPWALSSLEAMRKCVHMPAAPCWARGTPPASFLPWWAFSSAVSGRCLHWSPNLQGQANSALTEGWCERPFCRDRCGLKVLVFFIADVLPRPFTI